MDNFDQARRAAGDLLDPAAAAAMQRLAWQFLAGRAALFEARVAGGRVVDGPGDLLADDVFCLDDGPRILDCLDFDDRLRWLDGLDDAAFLAMDLERLGDPRLAERPIGWYAEYSADPAPPSLCHHYIAYRAFVRAKVAWLRSGQGVPAAECQARQLLRIAVSHLRATLALYDARLK